MSGTRVEGVTPDGLTLLVRLDAALGGHLVEVPLAEVRRAQRATPTLPLGGGPSPRDIQRRIRYGESAEQIAQGHGLSVADIARYEGPVLAERAHHAQRARRCDVDGRTVEDAVVAHFGVAADEVSWDCWQTDPRRWELQANAGTATVRLAYDPGTARVDPLDDAARQAFGLAPPPPDALQEVLRPVAGRRAASAGADPPPAPRRGRAQVPLWEEIDRSVSGRSAGTP